MAFPALASYSPTLPEKLQQIGKRSPDHLRAIESLADLVLETLKAEDMAAIRVASRRD